MMIAIVCFIILARFQWTEELSCHDAHGQLLCNNATCPKNLQCRGSVTKDACNCCEECMKQENEICGGINQRFGKCDHHVRFCEKLPSRSQKRCMTQVTALKMNIPHAIIKLKKCKISTEYKAMFGKDQILCFLKGQVPSYYCKKNLEYRDSDCCIHGDGCHPNEMVYEKIDANVLLEGKTQPGH